MFIDDVKNQYTYLNSLKNVVWEQPIEIVIDKDRGVGINPDIEPLLNKLTKERPTWRFKATARAYPGSSPLKLSRFSIYDCDEELGEVWLEHHWRSEEVRFFFTNFRLDKARRRHMPNYTTKIDVAAKKIVKAFHMKTPKERAAEAMEAVRTAVSNLHNETTWPLRKAKNAIEADLYNYAARNWDELKHILSPDAQKIDLPGLMQSFVDTYEMAKAASGGEGANVRIEPNGTYLVSRPENDSFDVVSYTDATLPDHLRGALGLLKMLDDKASVAGLGLRINRNLYFVMDKRDESNAT